MRTLEKDGTIADVKSGSDETANTGTDTLAKTGLLFESMNSNSLYEKLLLIIKDIELKERLALNGKIKADNFFDSEKQFEEIKNILERAHES